MRMLKGIIADTLFGLWILAAFFIVGGIAWLILSVLASITWSAMLTLLAVLVLAYAIGKGLDIYTKRTL